jgi:hypothetical protein
MSPYSVVLVADCTFAVLFGDLSVQQLPHFGWRSKFSISPGVMCIFDALDTKAHAAFLLSVLTTATEQRVVNRAVFILSEFHGISPDWCSLAK